MQRERLDCRLQTASDVSSEVDDPESAVPEPDVEDLPGLKDTDEVGIGRLEERGELDAGTQALKVENLGPVLSVVVLVLEYCRACE